MSDTPAAPRPDLGDPLIGQTLAGRYEILAPLGAGAAARVYRAVQRPMGRQVALKVIRPDVDESRQAQFEARFLREAAQAGRLSHPNLVTVHDFGRAEDGSCFLAMELLQGSTLKRLIDGRPLDPVRATRLVLDIARGLRHAHRRGMVHRDVKPGNIFVVRDDEDREQALLLDFGLVKADDDPTITRSGAFMGTPHYIAPEQARGVAGVDGRADLYSLGCIHYRLLTGLLPYEADNPMAIALKHLREPYPPMAQRAPAVAVDPALEAIVRRCMAKESADRYADAGELVRALQGWLGESAAEDPEPSTLAPAALLAPAEASPRRRSRGLVAALGLLLGLGGALTLWQAAGPAVTPPVVADPAGAAEAAPEASAPSLGEGGPPPAPAAGEGGPTDPAQAQGAPAPLDEGSAGSAGSRAGSGSAGSRASSAEASSTRASPTEAARPAAGGTSTRPAAAPSGAWVIADGVKVDAAAAERALRFANTADKEALTAAGVRGQQANIILGQRPFASLPDLAERPYIGEKTIEALVHAAP